MCMICLSSKYDLSLFDMKKKLKLVTFYHLENSGIEFMSFEYQLYIFIHDIHTHIYQVSEFAWYWCFFEDACSTKKVRGSSINLVFVYQIIVDSPQNHHKNWMGIFSNDLHQK